jgi:PadR family transcriptional regulator PadR
MASKSTETLGTREQLVLLAVARLPAEAYGITIRSEIEKRAGRSLSLGAIYPTLDRLEEQGGVIIDALGGRGR